MSPAVERRIVLGTVAFSAAGVFLISLLLEPDPRGYGTHEAFGLPPCGLKLLTDIPCPSCGMTTSFAHAARLDVAGSFRAHPCGLVLFGGVVVMGILSTAGVTGTLRSERLERWFHGFPWFWAGLIFFGSFFLVWGYRVLEAVVSG
jgi:hypothetical protein